MDCLQRRKTPKGWADAASALKKFRPQAKIAIPRLIELLKEKNKDVG